MMPTRQRREPGELGLDAVGGPVRPVGDVELPVGQPRSTSHDRVDPAGRELVGSRLAIGRRALDGERWRPGLRRSTPGGGMFMIPFAVAIVAVASWSSSATTAIRSTVAGRGSGWPIGVSATASARPIRMTVESEEQRAAHPIDGTRAGRRSRRSAGAGRGASSGGVLVERRARAWRRRPAGSADVAR